MQLVFAAAVVAGLWYLWFNLVSNLQRRRISTGFGFLDEAAGFRISGTNFSPGQPLRDAIVVGARNTLLIAAIGIALASVLGVVVGIARLSSNWLLRRSASLYVETLRNVPVLVVIIFFSAAVILTLPTVDNAIEWFDLFVLSKRGLWLPSPVARSGADLYGYVLGAAVALGALVAWWRTRQAETSGRPHHRVRFGAAAFLLVAGVGYAVLGGPIGLSFPERMARSVEGGTVLGPELAALLAGLVVYTASHIAEVVRGSIQSVPKGQSEAATALALTPWHRLRYVILPQALRVAIPPLANQYLNLTKNSSLAVVVGYPELMRITRIGIGSGAPAPQSIAVLMFIYLLISLTIAGVVNIANRRLELRGRR